MKYYFLLAISLSFFFCQSAEAPQHRSEIPEIVAEKESVVPASNGQGNVLTGLKTKKNDVETTFLTGHFSPANRPDFVPVEKPYSNKSGMMLQKEVFEAFKRMWEAAKKDGINLTIISSTRTFDQQKVIWENKWNKYANTKDPVARAERILEYSSMPGSSRHHWGTDMDLNDLNNNAFEGKGIHAKIYEWLTQHAAEYQFGQPYTPKNDQRPHGYNEEKWHWSYLPLAKVYRETYLKTIKDTDITGFLGSNTAASIKVVERYVGGVSTACQ